MIDDSDKLEYQTAYSNIKKAVESNLRVFKAFIDLEENQKVAQSHQNRLKHQVCRLV